MQKQTVTAWTALLLGTLLGAPLLADDVYLKNGRSFENVVAEVGDTQVRVHMPGGVISLPRSSVERVTKADSSFAEYSRRKQELESRDRGQTIGADRDFVAHPVEFDAHQLLQRTLIVGEQQLQSFAWFRSDDSSP